jgi:hypothetical protein
MATITTTLAPLALLACPLGMGLMMFFMGKGMMGGKKEESDTASVDQLKAEQEHLAAEVERLEHEAKGGELAEQR